MSPVTLIPLDKGWTFRQVGKHEWLEAIVPGNNFSDLRRNGLIDDPFFRNHETDLQWIGEEAWEYKNEFFLSADQLNASGYRLRFEGLDTFAEVWLNGHLIMNSHNMFRPWEKEVRSLLQEGLNELRVIFESPLKRVRPLSEAAGLTYPAGNDHSEEKLSVFARKAPYHYGWDWGPRFITSGIWQPVYLVKYTDLVLEEVIATSELIGKDGAELFLEVNCWVRQPGTYELQVDLPDKHMQLQRDYPLDPGHHSLGLSVKLSDIKRWYPRGMGTPVRYPIEVRLTGPDGSLHEIQLKHGFRKIELVREPDGYGTSFYFRVNDQPIFAKGVNYIPQDNFLDQVGPERYQKLFSDILAANMNMVRVWGGGIYERDLFYDLADQHGILVWQDFMFACTMYPGNDAFLENVRAEAIHQVRRLKNHPCIALWCGNNEIRVGWDNWGWQEEFEYSPDQEKLLLYDYNKLFEELLSDVVRDHAPETPYLPSSPMYDYADYDNYKHGDVHYWGVWHELAPFSTYQDRIPRFMSEYGFQSFPLMESVRKYTVEKDWDIESAVMQTHQKHPRGNGIIHQYLQEAYQPAKDFPSFLYLSQLLQAYGIRMAIEAHRKAKPFCMGTLYWQLNDCWPVASWSGIDYYGKWKALHYFVKKAYQDIILILDNAEDELAFEVLSDRFEKAILEAQITLLNLTGEIISIQSHQIEIPENGKVRLMWKGPIPEKLHEYAWEGIIKESGQVIYENTFFPEAPKEIPLELPTIQHSLEKVKNGHLLRLETNTLAKDMYLSTKSGEGHFHQNFIDLFPGRPKEIFLAGANEPEILFQTVRHTYL